MPPSIPDSDLERFTAEMIADRWGKHPDLVRELIRTGVLSAPLGILRRPDGWTTIEAFVPRAVPLAYEQKHPEYRTTTAPVHKREFTRKEAAAYVGVDFSTIRRWIDDGKLEATLTAGGHYRIRRSDLDKLKDEIRTAQLDKLKER